MAVHRLAAYSLAVYDRHSRERGRIYHPMDRIDGREKRIHRLSAEFESALQARIVNPLVKGTPPDIRVYEARQPLRMGAGEIYGRIMVGKGGERSDIARERVGDVVDVRPEDIAKSPVFYMIAAPPGALRGVLLTETIGRFGIRTEFWSEIRAAILQRNPDITMEMARYYPRDLIQAYDQYQGRVTKLVARSVMVEQHIAERDRQYLRTGEPTTIRTVVKRPWRLPTSKLVDVLTSDAPGAIEILAGEMGEHINALEPDEVDLEVTINGEVQTISIDRERAPQLAYPVGPIQTDMEGFPRLTDLVARAKEIMREHLHQDLGWR
jgi:hypothetical protein